MFLFGRSRRRARLSAIEAKLDRVLALLGETSKQRGDIMTTLADIKAKVEAETTVEQSAITLMGGLSQQLKDAIANGADPAVLQSIADELDANNASLAAAVSANTPA